MQRWIAIGAVALVLLTGGGVFALKAYRANRPDKVWVPMPLKPELPLERQEALVKELDGKLRENSRLVAVSKDVGLSAKWKIPNDQDGAREIDRRLFIELSTLEVAGSKVPAINIGVSGKREEHAVLGEVAMRLMKDVWKILGIEAPPVNAF